MEIIFDKVRTILHKQFSFQYEQIQPETQFQAQLGTDSREMLELINEFEVTFNIEINFDDVVKIITIQDAVNYIEKKMIDREKLDSNSL